MGAFSEGDSEAENRTSGPRVKEGFPVARWHTHAGRGWGALSRDSGGGPIADHSPSRKHS